jgi:hypothetical protein
MAVKAPRLKITTPTSGIIPYGRGFYQLEEEELYLPVEYADGRHRFHSFIDSETSSLHVDRDGRLIFVEVTLPKRRWHVRRDFIPPEEILKADIRFIDFRAKLRNPQISCNSSRNRLFISFSRKPSVHSYYLATNLIAQVTADNHLAGLWAFDIIDDMAGRRIASWRRAIRRKTTSSVVRVG